MLKDLKYNVDKITEIIKPNEINILIRRLLNYIINYKKYLFKLLAIDE